MEPGPHQIKRPNSKFPTKPSTASPNHAERGRRRKEAHGALIMVFVPSLLSERPASGIVRDLLARSSPDFGHQELSWSSLQGRDRFRKLAFRSLPAAASAARRGRCRGPGAVRMSSTPGEQPSVPSKGGDADNPTKTVNVIIKGKVQGVYYRNWTVDSAQQLGVNGWVRNLKDGSVEAVFSGKSAIVDSLIQKCHQGPSAARVSSVEVSAWKDAVPQGFERKPTIW